MPQDAFTLRALCTELNSTLKKGKINRIVQPDNDVVVFTVYCGKFTQKLLISVNPAFAHIGITEDEVFSPISAPNFCMLLRKHLLNATIDGISLIGYDRIIKISLTASNEFFDAEQKDLYIELMGRYSNIILTENGKILGGNRGINMFDDGIRPLIVGQKYVYPPVQNKLQPNDEKLIDIFSKFEGENFSEYFIKNVQGTALSTANEIVRVFCESNNISVNEFNVEISDGNLAEKFFCFINDFMYRKGDKPCVIIENGVKDFCAFPYKYLSGEIKYFDSLIDAEKYFFSKKIKQKNFISKRERYINLVNTQLRKANKRYNTICSKEKDALSFESNKIKGELILSNIYRIKNGQDSVELENYYDNNNFIKIELDKSLSISKNAENYFKKYNKQKRTLEALAPQKAQAESDKNYFESLIDELNVCENEFDLNMIGEELKNCGILLEQNNKAKPKTNVTFCRVYDINGFVVKVGRNNIENDKLTFTAKPESIWLHAKDYHSSHVIIEFNGKKIDNALIITVAEICAYYSAGRESGKVEIAYTERKNVKKPSHSKAGSCVYDNFTTVFVNPDAHKDLIKN